MSRKNKGRLLVIRLLLCVCERERKRISEWDRDKERLMSKQDNI